MVAFYFNFHIVLILPNRVQYNTIQYSTTRQHPHVNLAGNSPEQQQQQKYVNNSDSNNDNINNIRSG